MAVLSSMYTSISIDPRDRALPYLRCFVCQFTIVLIRMASHPKYKITYFPFEGRAEVARLSFFIAGIPFEDERVPFPEWPVRKPTTPWGSMPVLDLGNGRVLSQSNTINRFVGKISHLYPHDTWEAAQVDEIMDAVEDLVVKVAATIGLPAAELQAKRKDLADNVFPIWFERFQKRLQSNGGKHFVGHALTVADLKLYCLLGWISSGKMDHIPVDYVNKYPALAAFQKELDAHPKIKAWHESKKA